jgi:hypothetical protein
MKTVVDVAEIAAPESGIQFSMIHPSNVVDVSRSVPPPVKVVALTVIFAPDAASGIELPSTPATREMK